MAVSRIRRPPGSPSDANSRKSQPSTGTSVTERAALLTRVRRGKETSSVEDPGREKVESCAATDQIIVAHWVLGRDHRRVVGITDTFESCSHQLRHQLRVMRPAYGKLARQ